MKAVWTLVKDVPELVQYFPDFEDDELPDRSFMWTVLSTLRYSQCKQLINEARTARSKKSETNNDELIEIHPEFLEKLMAASILSTGKQNVE